LLGFVIIISGTVVGNVAIARMIKVVNENKASVNPDIFSAAEEIEPVSGKAARAAAIKKYREIQPQGRLYEVLQFSWVLNGIGFLIMLGGIFI
jgi:hypothetical protein